MEQLNDFICIAPDVLKPLDVHLMVDCTALIDLL